MRRRDHLPGEPDQRQNYQSTGRAQAELADGESSYYQSSQHPVAPCDRPGAEDVLPEISRRFNELIEDDRVAKFHQGQPEPRAGETGKNLWPDTFFGQGA